MVYLLRSRVTFIWMVLVAATGASWAIGIGHGIGLGHPRSPGIAIIVIAFIKVRFVILDFMEIRHAPLLMRFAGEAWVAAVCTTLVILYQRAPH